MRTIVLLLKTVVIFCILQACTGHYPDEYSQYMAFAPDDIPFVVADSAWDVDRLGNHRAIVEVKNDIRAGSETSSFSDAVKVLLPWRRPDLRPETKKIVVIDSKTGQEVNNVSILDFSSEKGLIAFQPQSGPGIYEIYYLSAKFRRSSDDALYGEIWNDYLPAVYSTDPAWEQSIKNNQNTIPDAKPIRFESRLKLDFFTSMGLIATCDEIESLKQKKTGEFMLFTEDRAFPIKLTTIPVRWIKDVSNNKFKGFALPNEYYTWQIGVWAIDKPLKNVSLKFSDFKHSSGHVISSVDITCFNTGGTNWDGQPIVFQVDVPQEKVQALWCGLQIPETVSGGKYKGTVTVTAEDATPQTTEITIIVGKEILADKGDGDLWRHARLRWLNSTIGMDDLPVPHYENMEVIDNTIKATGKILEIDNNGLPKSIEINGQNILSLPIEFVVETNNGAISFEAENLHIEKKADGLVQWGAFSNQDGLFFRCVAHIEFDGYMRFNILLAAVRETQVKDVKLITSYTPSASEYFIGAGFKGGFRPQQYTWDWKGPWDSYWIGGPLAGLHVEYRGGSYHGPLLNEYKPEPPQVWANAGKGKFTLSGNNRQTATIIASAGPNRLSLIPLDFEFALLITPVKPVNSSKHFSEKYFHDNPDNFAKVAEEGANIANINNAQRLNPYINYPYIVREPLIEYIKEQHADNRKVKLYNTVRELSCYATEIYALKSLNHEIFLSGDGYGVPWLCEHLIDDYKTARYSELSDQQSDVSLVLNGSSRWINYYLEGLRWMLLNYDIDGIYLDDASFERDAMKRIRKIFAQYKPSALIDLHSNTDYSITPANQYAGFFPYIDRLWFGENFKYNEMTPDEWFVTFSGIPFGLMSEMHQYEGNRFLGMVYGATARHSYGQNSPIPVWKLWKDFGIEEAQMLGYWDEKCPVTTNHQNVKATVYIRPGKALISIGNFDNRDQMVRLNIDWGKLGLDISKVTIEAPKIDGFQENRIFGINEPIYIKSKEGLLLLIRQ